MNTKISKTVILILALFFGLSNTKAQFEKTNCKGYELKGKVKKIVIKHYLAMVQDGKIINGEPGYYNESQDVDAWADFFKEHAAAIFNQDGNLVQVEEYTNGNTLISKTAYEYDTKGFVKKSLRYGNNDILDSKMEFATDKYGSVIQYTESLEIDKSFKPEVYNISYKYDSIGNIIELKDTMMLISTIYENGRKKLVKAKLGWSDKVATSSYDYVFNDKKELIQSTYKSNYDNSIQKTDFKNGNKIEVESEIKIEGRIRKIKLVYENDKFGNWIRRLNYLWDGSSFSTIPSHIVIREIEYY